MRRIYIYIAYARSLVVVSSISFLFALVLQSFSHRAANSSISFRRGVDSMDPRLLRAARGGHRVLLEAVLGVAPAPDQVTVNVLSGTTAGQGGSRHVDLAM